MSSKKWKMFWNFFVLFLLKFLWFFSIFTLPRKIFNSVAIFFYPQTLSISVIHQCVKIWKIANYYCWFESIFYMKWLHFPFFFHIVMEWEARKYSWWRRKYHFYSSLIWQLFHLCVVNGNYHSWMLNESIFRMGVKICRKIVAFSLHK